MAIFPSTAISSTGGYEIENSLRFNDDDTAYLSWTPTTAGNRKTWTWSGWVKRGNPNVKSTLFGTDLDTSTLFYSVFRDDATSNQLQIVWRTGSTTTRTLQTTASYRDTSAWYHIVIAFDSTQSTASDRLKLYVNGEEVDSYSTDNRSNIGSNVQSSMSSTTEHYLGIYGTSNPLDGYLAEVNFVDGQALTPADFGETGDYAEWKPIEYSGTYGTNGFYLPMNQDYTVEGFSAVTYTGNGNKMYVGGTGFQPDLVWIKERSSTSGHILCDSVRGVGTTMRSESTDAESTNTTRISALNTDGFTVGPNNGTTQDGETYVAWNWDMGGSTVSNTDGTITSSVRANTDYGQSVISYTGTGAIATVGHGLSSAPEIIFFKNRNDATNWHVLTTKVDDSLDILYLNLTNAKADTTLTSPTGDVFSIGTGATIGASGKDYIAYAFHSVTGYSKIGSYTGTGASGNSITTGFRPAFLMVKRTDSTSSWAIFDSTREVTNPVKKRLNADESVVEASFANGIDFTSSGFEIIDVSGAINASGGDYIYMAFADTRESAFWLDDSGNNNDWTPNNLTESDVSKDSPTNNFATLNPLNPNITDLSVSLSEGNLKAYGSAYGATVYSSTWYRNKGKWYYETTFTNLGITPFIGWSSGSNEIRYRSNGDKRIDGTSTAYGATWAVGDIIGIGADLDNDSVTFYKNGVSQGAVSYSFGDLDYTNSWEFGGPHGTDDAEFIVNFGQDSSFAGNKTAQGNQDSNGIGDFYYTPPTGFLALCSKNLPDPTVVPSEHFNTVLYTGNSTDNTSITGVGFQPDFTWIKNRSTTDWNILFDSIRGAGKKLYSNETNSEYTDANSLQVFESDGFEIGTDTWMNTSGESYASWNWKANGTGVSNTDGTITSTVSANADAGFSIVSWTGDGTVTTIGHGLSKAPEITIIKNRIDIEMWFVYTTAVDGSLDWLRLNTTNAAVGSGESLPTSDVFEVWSGDNTNGSGDAMIAYCFHSVDGYSKVGSYTGNGSTDGTFVYTGFRPAYILLKRSDSTSNWYIHDSKRDIDNYTIAVLYPDGSYAENSSELESTYGIDFVSNGFKIRASHSTRNASGGTYIYLAFAESPFKHSNAR